MTTRAKNPKRKNAPDSTLRNTQASGKRLTALENKLSALTAKVRDLRGDVAYLLEVESEKPSNRI
jgi:hypothetical protein